MKRCVFDGALIVRKTTTQWKCIGCGLVYGTGLMTNRDNWREFRRKAKVVLAVSRTKNTDEEIRPQLGILMAAVLKEMGGVGGDKQ